eukprot:gene28289-36505_t
MIYTIPADAMLPGLPDPDHDAGTAGTAAAASSTAAAATETPNRPRGGRATFASVAGSASNVHVPPAIHTSPAGGKRPGAAGSSSGRHQFEWVLIAGNEDGQLITQDLTMLVTKAGALEHMKKHEAALSVYQKFKPKRYRLNDASDYNTTYLRMALPDTWLEKISTLRAFQARGELRPISILVGNGGLFLDFEMERGVDGAMTGYAFPEMLVDVVRLQKAGRRDEAHDLFDAHLPLLRYEQQQGVGLAVRKYVLMRRGWIASDAQRKPAAALSAAAREEIEFLLARLARRDPRANLNI